ncbi:hypothetical protein lerEdw1_011445 [Lerista edwardsae]|nr:hypothetical protein lerEdw1_011445 [Lerista edwardsae]
MGSASGIGILLVVMVVGIFPPELQSARPAGVYSRGWAGKAPLWTWGDERQEGRAKMGSASGLGALLALMVVGAFSTEGQSARPPEHFMYQTRGECGFPNGTGPGVYVLGRYFWGRQEIVRFDSRRGSFEALTELGEPDAQYWNRDRDLLEQFRAEVDRFCRYNYGMDVPFVSARKLKPQLQITPMDADFSSPHHTLLVCSVDSFFPAKINITWLRNGQEEDKGRVVSTELIRNGDWTFSIQVMLETQPERGDVYACRVEHASLPEPTSVQWGRRSQQQGRRPSACSTPQLNSLGCVRIPSGKHFRPADD